MQLVCRSNTGCELLKCLVMGGFHNIQVVDLDTIDVSNLNRQFLFRKHHVGMSKALVRGALALATKRRRNGRRPPCSGRCRCRARVQPRSKGPSAPWQHQGCQVWRFFLQNVPTGAAADQATSASQSRRMPPDPHSQVINALDNMSARRHVNRMCMSVDVPLIDAGTTGHIGQVECFRRGVTECYDCQPRGTAQKTYPICTIRSTPDKPVHCIVWAKELYKLLIGAAQQSMLWEDEEGGDTSAFMKAAAHPTDTAPDALAAHAKAVFEAVFHDEIEKKLSMRLEAYERAGRVPVPLSLDTALGSANAGQAVAPTALPVAALPAQTVPSLSQSAQQFCSTLARFFSEPEQAGLLGSAEFSKDRPLDLAFVTAASNLRSHIFGIPLQSQWTVASIAGNIIPAVATSNAIVAAGQVAAAMRLVKAGLASDSAPPPPAQRLELKHAPAGGGALTAAVAVEGPNPSCMVCGSAVLTLVTDTHRMTLAELFSAVLRGRLALHEPNIDNGEGLAELDAQEEDETPEEFQVRRACLGAIRLPASSHTLCPSLLRLRHEEHDMQA